MARGVAFGHAHSRQISAISMPGAMANEGGAPICPVANVDLVPVASDVSKQPLLNVAIRVRDRFQKYSCCSGQARTCRAHCVALRSARSGLEV